MIPKLLFQESELHGFSRTLDPLQGDQFPFLQCPFRLHRSFQECGAPLSYSLCFILINVDDLIASNLRRLRRQIDILAQECGRRPSEIDVLAVTKTWPAETVDAAARAGQRLFGENRVQETQEKRSLVQTQSLEWHLIGHLQSNKAGRAAELFEVIETVDREAVAGKLSQAATRLQKRLSVFIQVNIGGEPQKSGVAVYGLTALARAVAGMDFLDLVGLMAIPPFHPEAEQSRPYFHRLHQWQQDLNGFLASPLHQLSMGMSHDFPVAIQEGSTLVRVGTRIFGTRRESRAAEGA